ncbi:MAG: IS3 family transposase [Gammaproteobacteria bacterium]|nr:MAG: IS3 family transposase [Gammaproteobacteria bacterium]
MVKKKYRSPDVSISEQRACIDSNHESISILRQCELVGLPRSSYYQQPCSQDETIENLNLMLIIDKEYTKYPFYGSRKIRDSLRRKGHPVNRKRIQRLMRKMGIKSIAPQPNTSKPHPEHKVYPYLLRNLDIVCPDQVWSTDITYIPFATGFVYLVAVIDWFSRYVLSWEISMDMEASFCISTLERALRVYGRPEIFNTDQGAQFTSKRFTDVLKDAEVSISMDGRGRALDNIFIERLWRSVKYEEIYIKEYSSVNDLIQALKVYFDFYNTKRPHASLGIRTPGEVYANCNNMLYN